MDVQPAHLNRDSFRDSFKGLVALEIIIDIPLGFSNKQHYLSIGQTTHQNSFKKIGLRRIFLLSLACSAFCLIKTIGLHHIFFTKKNIRLNQKKMRWPNVEKKKSSSQSFCGAFNFKCLILSTNKFFVKVIRTPIISDHNNTICTKQL